MGLRLVRPVHGRIVDISGLGLGVESERALKVRQDYKFLLRRGLQMKSLRGHVQWCALRRPSAVDADSQSLVFRVGIALDNLRPQDWTFLSASFQSAKPPEQ